MSARQPLYFTFGNHMHWVDMQWLWGYDALPRSIHDMLALCDATGARGNVNFEGVGYEKLAAEDPGALAALREAVADGRIEVVGASYGQPYGLFHGGESNVRQRVFGVRAALRLLGARPRAFWEEEFDFCPQLPQILAGAGFTGASLFFQWTWHTPTVPEERVPLVLWEGVDGTRLPAVAKTELCLHQWPEDFDGRLESPLVDELEKPAIVQWLELMPSPDWMCRSEVLLPRLQELFADPRFELRPRTLSGLIEELGPGDAPVRRYGMDDVFHGVTLGKNGDHMVRLSLRAEEQLRAAEALMSALGLWGRPYASWDVYPSWELDEAWRELLAAQHHDNHECEGLCGAIGERSFERSDGLSGEVLRRGLALLAGRVPAGGDEVVVVNPSGWPRDVHVGTRVARAVPAFGWAAVGPEDEAGLTATVQEDRRRLRLSRGKLAVSVDRATGLITELRSPAHADDLLEGRPLGALEATFGGEDEAFADVETQVATDEESGDPVLVVHRGSDRGLVETVISLARQHDAVHVTARADLFHRPDGGMHAGLSWHVPWPAGAQRLLTDTPYAVGEVVAERDHVRKYPRGDWMTSPQWFETVRRPFTAHSLVDLVDDAGAGLLVLHDGSQAWFRVRDGVRCLLDAYDPWDEGHHRGGVSAELALVPHAPLTHAERWRLAREHSELPMVITAEPGPGDLPRRAGPLTLESADGGACGVAVTAFFRECRKSFEHLTEPFGPEVRNPYVARLVELDGRPAKVRLVVPGPVALAARTNLMGEVQAPLDPELAPTPSDACGRAPDDAPWSALTLELGPHEIVTVMLDLEPGRHVPRNLDEHRHIWATVHRRPGS